MILHPEITGINVRKYDERQAGRLKRDGFYPATRAVTMVPNNAIVKVKLAPDDRFVGHEITKNMPTDDVRVIIEKQPGQMVRAMTPPPTVYRSVSPVTTSTVVQNVQPVVRRKAPIRNVVTTTQAGGIENYSSPVKAETIVTQTEVQRSFVPTRSPV